MKASRRAPTPQGVSIVARMATLVVTSVLLIPVVTLHGAWHRFQIRRRVRRLWNNGPRLVLCLGSTSADAAMKAHWHRLAGSRTILIDTTHAAGGLDLPPITCSASDVDLAQNIVGFWGPDMKFVRPPVALLVSADGAVKRVELVNSALDSHS